jgi:hypothetical protein
VRNTYIDYLRAHSEYQRTRDSGARRLRRLRREPLDDDTAVDDIDPLTALEIRRIIECLSSDVFPPDQGAAISMWLRGYDNAEIARELELDGLDAAAKLLHAARQRLRRAVHGGTR